VEKWDNVIIITTKHLLLLVLYNRFSTTKSVKKNYKKIKKKIKNIIHAWA
jgi:hypothetical protein